MTVTATTDGSIYADDYNSTQVFVDEGDTITFQISSASQDYSYADYYLEVVG